MTKRFSNGMSVEDTLDTLARAQVLGMDAAVVLQANRAYDFFAAVDQLVLTGPTRTNINDFRAVLVC